MENDELRVLRQEAYGRNADTLTPERAQRLRELERQLTVLVDPATVSPDPVREPEVPLQHVDAGAPVAESVGESPDRGRPWSKPRRSSVLIAVAVLAFVIAVATALTLVQRVQTDPLQAGAQQVARLSPDSTFELPKILTSSALQGDTGVTSFAEFYGLRPVIGSSLSVTGAATSDRCLTVYPSDTLASATSDSISGAWFVGCAAGGFPAMAQFTVQDDANKLPVALQDHFPEGTALQFVYDQPDNQVVVFALLGAP